MSHARRLSPVAVLALVAWNAVACVGATPGWTYTPAPSITPAPSVAASASPGTVPSGSPGAGPSAAAGAVEISASGIAFEQTSVRAPAGAAFQISFDNKDAGVPHNVAIHKDNANGAEVFKGDIVTGPSTATYDVPALDAGTYAFVCSVHPNMTGTLTAG
jgi:plastocyanin